MRYYCPKCMRKFGHLKSLDFLYCKDCKTFLKYDKCEILDKFKDAFVRLPEWKRFSKIQSTYFEELVLEGGIIPYPFTEEQKKLYNLKSLCKSRMNLVKAEWIILEKITIGYFSVKYIKINEELIVKLIGDL